MENRNFNLAYANTDLVQEYLKENIKKTCELLYSPCRSVPLWHSLSCLSSHKEDEEREEHPGPGLEEDWTGAGLAC